MGRAPCCDKTKVKRGPWSPEEDYTLKKYVETYGTGGNWIALPHKAGLKRCGKSCRLRWLNYLRPNIKHGGFTEEEDNIILSLYHSIGSRWSVIASQLPGRTDNDVKNYWNTKLKKKLLAAAAAPTPKPSYHPTVPRSNASGNYVNSSTNINPNISITVDDMQLPYFPTDVNSKQETTMVMGLENTYDNNMLGSWAAAYSSSSSFSMDNRSGSWTTSSSANNGSSWGEDDALFLAGLMMNSFDDGQDDQQQMGYANVEQLYQDFDFSSSYPDFLIGQQQQQQQQQQFGM